MLKSKHNALHVHVYHMHYTPPPPNSKGISVLSHLLCILCIHCMVVVYANQTTQCLQVGWPTVSPIYDMHNIVKCFHRNGDGDYVDSMGKVK